VLVPLFGWRKYVPKPSMWIAPVHKSSAWCAAAAASPMIFALLPGVGEGVGPGSAAQALCSAAGAATTDDAAQQQQ
jgi:hypothetical protein